MRQALGAVLLEADRAVRAEATYRRDLEQYPRNGWSLFGLARSLEALSGKDTEEAVKAYEAFLKQFPDSVYAKSAQERVTVLKSS